MTDNDTFRIEGGPPVLGGDASDPAAYTMSGPVECLGALQPHSRIVAPGKMVVELPDPRPNWWRRFWWWALLGCKWEVIEK